MISYVEFYRPLFFLLENVEGILSYSLEERNELEQVQLKKGVKMGVVKFIMRALTALG